MALNHACSICYDIRDYNVYSQGGASGSGHFKLQTRDIGDLGGDIELTNDVILTVNHEHTCSYRRKHI
jgi:hypothetical protein